MGIFAVAKALEIPCYLGPEESPASHGLPPLSTYSNCKGEAKTGGFT
jgi:hypothetical protein